MLRIVEATCDECGKQNSECAIFKHKVFVFFKLETAVCQSCVSKIFRSFKKNK